LKGLYQNCTPGPGSPCYAGGDGPDILDDIKSAGLTANNEVFSYNQDTYMTESTMQTLWNSWGGGTIPRIVNWKTVSFRPSSGENEALLRIENGVCVTNIFELNTRIINTLSNDCLKRVYSDLMDKNISNEIKRIFNEVFEDGTKFNVTFKDDLPESGNLGETSIISMGKDGENLIALDVEINLNASTLSNYSKEYMAFAFIHEMLHAYYDSKPELFPPGDLNDPEVVHHINMLSQYLEQTAQFINGLYGTDIQDMKMLALGALKDQVLANPNDVIYNSLKLDLDFTDAQISAAISNYISGGHRCN